MKKNRERITLEDLAKCTGVSVSSVSRVINNQSVSSEIRDKVEAAISELRYKKPNSFLSHAIGSQKFIAIFVLDILNPFYPALIKGIEDIASVQGYNIILCDTRNDDESQHKRMEALINYYSVKGIIYIPLAEENPFIDRLLQEEFPIVFVDNIINRENTCYVTSANIKGAYQAVKYLISLGHRRIVYLAGDQKFSTERERFEGYKMALNEANIAVEEELIIPGDYNLKKAYHGINEIIKKKIPFTAIFAANDIMAFGAKQALDKQNLKVPEDVSLIGFDDLEISSTILLTTFAQPAYEMGKNAALLLIDLIHGRLKPPKHIVLQPTIVIRDSCKKLEKDRGG